MTTTVAVTCLANDQNGNPVAGAVLTATLDKTEIYGGFVVPERVQAIADATGTAVLHLWPNALGVNGSMYTITAVNPGTGKRFIKTTVSVPNSACNLHQIITAEPYPAIDASAQALAAAQGALALVTAQADIATAKAVLAAADAAATAADVVAAQASSDAAQADMLQAQADAVQTALDRIATSADLAQTALDRAATGADAAQTGDDVLATAADRVQTGMDRAQTILARAATTADLAKTTIDKAATAADVAQAALIKNNVTALAAEALASATAASQGAGTATTKALEALASANLADSAGNATIAQIAASTATNQSSTATTARIAAESARDAALIQAGVYTTEALGRAAVADGVAFKVQGSGDVAAYEYRRVSAGVVSTLIATYPSISGVLAKVDAVTGTISVNKQKVIGVASPVAGTSGSGNTTFVLSGQAMRDGLLEEVNIYSSHAQAAKIKIFRRNGYKHISDCYLAHDISVNLVVGLNTFSYQSGTLARYDIVENDIVGFYNATSITYITPGSGAAYIPFAGDQTANISDYATDATGGLALQVNAKIRYTENSLSAYQVAERTGYGGSFSIGELVPFHPLIDLFQGNEILHCFDVEFRQSAVLKQISTYTSGVGTINVVVLEPYLGGYRVFRIVPILSVAAGSATYVGGVDFPVDVFVPKGGLIGTWGQTVLYADPYHDIRTRDFYSWPIDGIFPSYDWPPAGISNSGTRLYNNAMPQIRLDFEWQQSPRIVPGANQYILSDEFDGTYGPVLLEGDAWTKNTGKMTSESTGLTNPLFAITGITHCSQLTTRVRFTFDSAGSAIYIFKYGEGGQGTLFAIDMTGNAITLYNTFASPTVPGVYSTRASTLTFQTGRTYIAELTKDFKDCSLTITDSITGASDSVAYDGYVNGVAAGFCYGTPGVAAKAGTISIEQFQLYSTKKAPQVICFGDSITEGTGASKTTAWANRVAINGNGVTSGRGGEGIDLTKRRVFTELNLLPSIRYVIIAIGTNDAWDATTWPRTMINICKELLVLGVTPIIGTLGPETGDANPVTNFNPWIRASGYRYVDFARALTVNGDGVTRDESKFADPLHPNEAGHLAMYNRVRLDVPELFD